jgi:hypothetical protein
VVNFNLNLNDFPELQKIIQSRHEIVDMAFGDPKDSKYISLFVLEDLFTGVNRLLKKLFYRLIRENQTNNARGLYDRHSFGSWCTQDIIEVASKIKYDPTKDFRPVDKFGPLSEEKYILPKKVKVHFISKEVDCEDLELLLG